MIAVLDYGIGNLASAMQALRSIGADARLVTDPDAAAEAEALVLPGVGAFGPCITALRQAGLDSAVRSALDRGIPFLGICVGFQMLYESSDESPGVPGLGVLSGRVTALSAGQKRPQMQWNLLERVPSAPSTMLEGLGPHPWLYFVHSFAPVPASFGPSNPGAGGVVAVCEYGGAVVAAVEAGPLWAVQFHPEKSGETGLSILRNFLAMAQRAA